MKTILFICILGLISPFSLIAKEVDSCMYNDLKLYGKIKFVEHSGSADLKIQFVNSFADLKVKFVGSFANKCGLWKVVDSFPDLKVYITDNSPDLKVKVVGSFPGYKK